MITLTNRRQAAKLAQEGIIPQIALSRKLRKENVLVLESSDDVVFGMPHFGRYGLITFIDDHDREQFSSVRFIVENGQRFFAAVTTDRAQRTRYTIVAPDAPWLDHRLRLIFEVEAEEEEG